MYPVERRQWMVARARAAGRLDVAEAAGELGVAVETVRRDLTELEGAGFLRRVYGGAIPVDRVGFEGGLDRRAVGQRAEKLRIAKLVVDLIEDAESVFLDEGSTCQIVAEIWQPTTPVTVVTAALASAQLLCAKGSHVTVVLLGGRIRHHTMATSDHWPIRMLSDHVIDLGVFGTNGVTVSRGLTVPDPAVGAVKSAAMASCRRSLLAADHTKVGMDSFVRFANVADLTYLVTDGGIAEVDADAIRAVGVQVHAA